MGAQRIIDLEFPAGGLDRRSGYQWQPPYTTPDCKNVCPDPRNGRRRGGQRPGLRRAYTQRCGITTPNYTARCMSSFRYNANTAHYWTDNFSAAPLRDAWTEMLDYNPQGTVTFDSGQVGGHNGNLSLAWQAFTDLDTTEPYKIAVWLIPRPELSRGYGIAYAWLDNTTPDPTDAGLRVKVAASETTGKIKIEWEFAFGGAVTDNGAWTNIDPPGYGVLTLRVTSATLCQVYWGHTLVGTADIGSDPGHGQRFGVGTQPGSTELYTWLDKATIAWKTTAAVGSEELIVSAGGKLYAGTSELTEVAASGLSTSAHFQAAERLGKVYFGNYGTTKVFDPTDTPDMLTTWSASAGSVPQNCPLICVWRDRMVLGGADATANEWAMSRQGDPDDWDYSVSDLDPGRPIAGTSAAGATIGAPLTTMIPWTSDYLLFACERSLWLMRGDPAAGGQFGNLSNDFGVIQMNAWCRGPADEIIFLSRQGPAYMAPGAGPVPLMKDSLPAELVNINADDYWISMAFDLYSNRVHLYLTPTSGDAGRHWWCDWNTRSWWPVELVDVHQPSVVYAYPGFPDGTGASCVLLASLDGYVLNYVEGTRQDTGTEAASTTNNDIDSYLLYGPVRLGGDTVADGLLLELNGLLAEGEEQSVTWQAMVGQSHETAASATARASGTWSAGRNTSVRPRVRGPSLFLKLAGIAEKEWQIEEVTARLERLGRIRKRA